MSRKTNPRRRPATMADVERAKQEAQVWDEVNYLSESIVQGYVSLADLRHTLRTERGIEI